MLKHFHLHHIATLFEGIANSPSDIVAKIELHGHRRIGLRKRSEIIVGGVEALSIGVEHETKLVSLSVEQLHALAAIGVVVEQCGFSDCATLGADVDFQHIVLQCHCFVFAGEALCKIAALGIRHHSGFQRSNGLIASSYVG